MVLLWCADIFNVAVEVWLAYWLFDVPKHRRFHQPWVRVLEYLGFLGIPGGNILWNRIINIRFSNVQIIFLILIFFIVSIIFTKRNMFCCLAWAGIYYGTISLLELPGIILSGWIIGQPYLYCIYHPVLYDYIFLVILSFGLWLIWRKWGIIIQSYLNNSITRKNALLWIILSSAEWWVITYFLTIGYQETGRDVFFYNVVSIVCILFLIFGFVTFIVYRQSESQRHQKEIQNARMETEYVKIKNEYQRKSREIHDLKHQLQALKAYLAMGQIDNVQKYLQDMISDFEMSKGYIHAWTGNPLLDSLLGGKMTEANKLGVAFDIHSSKIVSFLSDKDVSVLLGNLLDNALEAAEKVNGDKFIEVHILDKGNMEFFKVKNSIAQLPKIKDGKLITSKSDKINHGWGLQSIAAIVEKYGGQMDINYDKEYFEVNITFWEKEVPDYGERN